MLTAHPRTPPEAKTLPVWIDLVNPSDDERRRAGELLGAELPTRKEVASLALSNRVRSSERMLCINVPGFVRGDAGLGALTPLGILLTPALLVTLRYADSIAFDRMTRDIAEDTAPASSIDAFVCLFETVAEVAAERMQALSEELSHLSRDVFADSPGHSRRLRGLLFKTGLIQRELSQVRSAMLGVERGLSHLCEGAPPWIDADHAARLHVVLTDLRSLADFDEQMDDKAQFALDATLGFINNDQNDTIKVLTIASVVTIPPVILAGIWGMNFKSIPEFDWPHGYAFALVSIVLSMLLPLAWFKWKRWF